MKSAFYHFGRSRTQGPILTYRSYRAIEAALAVHGIDILAKTIGLLLAIPFALICVAIIVAIISAVSGGWLVVAPAPPKALIPKSAFGQPSWLDFGDSWLRLFYLSVQDPQIRVEYLVGRSRLRGWSASCRALLCLGWLESIHVRRSVESWTFLLMYSPRVLNYVEISAFCSTKVLVRLDKKELRLQLLVVRALKGELGLASCITHPGNPSLLVRYSVPVINVK
ncbi:hypothetical protein ARMGADRAFT_1022871 [Armillaria gallica]|uniref:Uncharacterized protein n=1 Tax=Armillaria gallica TaxID=47427 RepID=A0A2H3EAK9_ARMGA|nr:hypothetical protein ARMGADRAFT_1022871 [Armillaria gallica]